MSTPSNGPEPRDHAARLRAADGFVRWLNGRYPGRVLAVALYGSTAGGRDGPYSDIEMFCVLDEEGIDVTFEWAYGPGKAEINVYGMDRAAERARAVTDDWALSRGQFTRSRHLSGDKSILRTLRSLADSATDGELHRKAREIIVEDLYELIGKLRNATASGRFAYVPTAACSFARSAAFMVGLYHRCCYSTGATVLEESLLLPDLPSGYAELCATVTKGDLSDPRKTIGIVEAAWAGILDWAETKGLGIRTSPLPPA